MRGMTRAPRLARAAGLLAAGASALALAACGEDRLDVSSAEPEIADGFEAAGLDKPNVECPEEVEARVGETFTCDVPGEDGTIKVKMKVTAVSEDRGQVDLADTAAFQKQLADEIAAQ